MKTILTFRYLLIASIVLILIALVSWYFFVRAKQADIAREDAGRGAGLSAQSFGSRLGSTHENIVSGFSEMLVGERKNENAQQEGPKVPRLAQVNKTPTAGAGFVGSSTSPHLRFVERSTGFVFDAIPETLEIARLTNTLVPSTYEALIAKSGRMVIRSAGENGRITTFAASIATGTPSEEGLRQLIQEPLPDGIRSIVASPTGNEILYIAEVPDGGVGIRSTWNATKQKQLFSSALSGWQVHWPSSDRIILVQAPSDGATGYAYEVGKDGALSTLVQKAPGLTLLPHPSSPALLYGESSGGLALFTRVDEKSSAALLPVRTIADKCVWSPVNAPQGGAPGEHSASQNVVAGKSLIAYCAVPQSQPPPNFLDRWHRGEVHTRDAWWRVNVSAASAEILLSPGDTALDVENPIIDGGGKYIAFVNAVDKSLWLLRIAEN